VGRPGQNRSGLAEEATVDAELKKNTPWDFFIHLLAVIALYTSIVGALLLVFQLINLRFPDPMEDVADVTDDIRLGIALIVIFFPAYLWSWRAIERDLSANPAKERLRIRTCPIYLTLFLAGLLLLVDSATLVYYFMTGALTSRFILKIVAVLVVTAGVFLFHLDALRGQPGTRSPSARVIGPASIAAAIALIVAGFVTAGSPTHARFVRQDDERIRDLDLVQGKIVDYWQDKQVLPDRLDQLADQISGFSPPLDPLTNRPFDYHATARNSFELCADFALKDDNAGRVVRWKNNGLPNNGWNHASGHQCFARTIDPSRYPAKKNGN
jgi:hypothetical protein